MAEEAALTTELGAAVPGRALDAGVTRAWVTGDGVCGADRALRRRIEARGGLGHVLAVTGGRRVGGRGAAGGLVPAERRRVDAWAAKVPPEGWHRPSAGEGAKGPRLHDRAVLPHRGAPPGRAAGPLVRRELDGPDEPAFHLTPAPPGTDLATLVRGAGTRRTVEACFGAAEGEVGLDEHEVRS